MERGPFPRAAACGIQYNYILPLSAAKSKPFWADRAHPACMCFYMIPACSGPALSKYGVCVLCLCRVPRFSIYPCILQVPNTTRILLARYAWAQNAAPVSYTHLDLYKRQIIGRADGRYEQSVTLLNCTNRGEVNGGSYHVGGIAGSADGTAITGCPVSYTHLAGKCPARMGGRRSGEHPGAGRRRPGGRGGACV